KWRVNQWLKKAVLLSFRLNDMGPIAGGPGGANWWDKVPSKFDGWGENRFRAAGFRAVPGSVVRRSAYIAPNVVLMPSFVNLDGRIHRRLDQDRRPRNRRSAHGRGAGLLGGRAWLDVWQADEERPARPKPLLRRDRQARGRTDAGEDEHQRTPARLADLHDHA